MPTVDIYNVQHEKVGSYDLSDAVFGAEVHSHLLHAVVRYQLAARRAGTHKVKQRSEISGGGKKPWRQKGTGRARQGSSRSPQWRGGGVVFGPTPRDHGFKLNKKVRAKALCSALSKRVADGDVVVLDALALETIKTRQVTDFLGRFGLNDMLLVLGERDQNVEKSARNIPTVTVVPSEGLNVYDVLRRKNLVMTRAAVDAISARLGG